MIRGKWMALRNGALPSKLILTLLGLSMLPMASALAADNMRFHGALVAEPCTIAPGTENIERKFGTIVVKYLYINQRTHGEIFTLPLTECDISLGNSVKVTFLGPESTALPGLLALDASSQAAGIAIGVETLGGKSIPINQSSNGNQLVQDNSPIRFIAYVQGEPEAIAQQSIRLGPFNAMVTFSLEYE